ncbi:MAG: hypothetical protein LVS60_18575 [Nodosilinea sp. LVE1205-7]|jgi:hypothetical protein
MTDQGSADVMGRQARDRPPKGVIDRPHCGIAPGAAIPLPLRLLGLGLLPGLGPTAPATKAEPKVILWGAGDIEPQGS